MRTERADRGRGRVPGLSIRKTAAGETVYRLRFRLDGKMPAWTFRADGLAAARRMAEAARVKAANGEDPRPRKHRGGLTLLGAAARWVWANRRRWKRRTRREYVGLLRRRILPDFGDRDPRAVTRGEIRLSLDRIAAKTPTEANRTRAAWGALYSWLGKPRQEHLAVDVDPTRGLERPAEERPRERVYTDAELRAILKATTGTDLGDLVEFLAHTAVRDNEARGLKWEHIDSERGVWTIPGELTKNGRPHSVPLSKGALAVLRRRERTRFLDGHVFGFARQSKHLRAAAIAAKLLRNVGTEENPKWEGQGLRLHDLRRTVGDRLRQEFGEAVMHAALGHADARLTLTYGPSPRLRALADALEWWSDELARIRKAKNRKASATATVVN